VEYSDIMHVSKEYQDEYRRQEILLVIVILTKKRS